MSTSHASTAAKTGGAPDPLGTGALGTIESTYRKRRGRKLLWNLIPAGTFIALLLIWAGAVPLFKIPAYLLPGPVDTFARIITDFPELWSNSVVTMTEVAAGFAISILIAIPLGLVIALSRLGKQILYPPIIFIQLIPKIAIAPLFVVWLGFGIQSKILLTLLLTFFPLLISSISGFQILDDRLLYLTRSMGASRWQTFRFLRFPAALPVIFAGLKTSATVAVTAAIVAEFVGANVGLGYVLLRGTSNLDTTLVFAVLVVLTLIGLALNYIVEFAEWLLTPWQRHKNN